MSKPDPPPPPDFTAAAREQGEANIEASIASGILNNPNVVTPYGSQVVTTGGGPIPNPYASQTFTGRGGATWESDPQGFRIDQRGQRLPNELRVTPFGDVLVRDQYSGYVGPGNQIYSGVNPARSGNIAEGHPFAGQTFTGREGATFETGPQGYRLKPSGERSKVRITSTGDVIDHRGKLVAHVGPNNQIVPGINPNPLQQTVVDGQVIERPTITQTLSPDQQAIYEAQTGLSQGLLGTAQRGLSEVDKMLGVPLDVSGMTQPQDLDLSQLTERTVAPTVGGLQSVSDAVLGLYEPDIAERERQRLDELMIQGHPLTGAAYGQSERAFADERNRLRMAALLAAGQEQSRLFGMEGALRGQQLAEQQGLLAGDTAQRQRQIQEAAYLRQLPLTEINALRTGSQPVLPQFQSYAGQPVGPAPYFQGAVAQNQAALQNYQQEVAQRNALLGGLFDIGSAGLYGIGQAGGFGSFFG